MSGGSCVESWPPFEPALLYFEPSSCARREKWEDEEEQKEVYNKLGSLVILKEVWREEQCEEQCSPVLHFMGVCAQIVCVCVCVCVCERARGRTSKVVSDVPSVGARARS